MPAQDAHRVVCHLDDLLERSCSTLTDLARAVGVTVDVFSVTPAHAPEPTRARSDA